MPDDITRAVFAHDDVARYLRGDAGEPDEEVRARIAAYLDELRTTQRYSFYRALKHPLYPILRKIERHEEGIAHVRAATAAGRVIYVSNHKSHIDYLVEPLVLDDNGIRPPIIAAGINLFGGPLGLLHRHVTGAIPIRRNTKDPAYLVTLKVYIGELLRQHDLLFYLEGGRSYSGEMKTPKTGLLHATMLATHSPRQVVPLAVAYDLVLEDHILPHAGGEAPREALLARGGRDGALRGGLPVARRSSPSASRSRSTGTTPSRAATCWRSPTRSAGASAGCTRCCRRRCSPSRCAPRRRARSSRRASTRSSRRCAPRGRTWASSSGRQAVEEATDALVSRNIIVVDRAGRYRVRDRAVLRYYSRTIQHSFAAPTGQTWTH